MPKIKPENTAVILTTYNQPEWLRKTLWGYEFQTCKGFEIVISDDGSDERTKKVIDEFADRSGFPVRHVWQEDKGFRKCRILNKAIVQTPANYLIFSDGDCIPKSDFVEQHVNRGRKGHFLSGGYFKLGRKPSEIITRSAIEKQLPFSAKWLIKNGQGFTYRLLKLQKNPAVSSMLEKFTPTRSSWNGHNSSGWKEDLLAVNGYNEDMQYGGLDRELGERLENSGIKGLQIRYSAVCLHLDHPRPYKNKATLEKNRAIRDQVVRRGISFTPNGIIKEKRNPQILK